MYNGMMSNMDIFDGAYESVLLYQIQEVTFDCNLIYSNDKANELFEDRGQEKGDISQSINELLGISSEKIGNFVMEKVNGVNLIEERLIKINDSKSDFFLTFYNALITEKGYLIQITLRPLSRVSFSNSLKEIENNINVINFSSGQIALVTIRNYSTLLKAYGYRVLSSVRDIICEELTKEFSGKSDVFFTDKSIFIHYSINNAKNNILSDKVVKALGHVRKRIFEENINVFCNFKVGISSWGKDKYNALHEAKYCLQCVYDSDEELMVYTQPDDTKFMEFLIKSDLPYAIDNNELDVNFQGIFDIKKNELYGFEVLIRWKHKKYGEISPSVFIPIAETTELITKLDLWVLKNALEKFSTLEKYVRDDIKLNFNVSPRDFFDAKFTDEFLRIIDESDVPYENIILELTETLNLSPKKSSIEQIKRKGVMVALDDFGTGFASLSQIKNYNIDFLKIDITFVRDIYKNYDNTLIISAILSMANNLNIGVIAEGIESDEQIKFLQSRKCRFVQGFKFHKPMTFNELKIDLYNRRFEDIENNHEPLIINKKDYVMNYKYGKYIYVPLDLEGKILTNNDRLAELLEHDDIQQLNFSDLILEPLKNKFQNHMVNVAHNHNHVTFSTKLIRDIPVIITLEYDALEDSVELFIENYQYKVDEFNRIKNLYNRYDLIFDEISNAVIITNKDFEIEEWNKSATLIFGYERDEVIGKNSIKLLTAEEEHKAMNIIVNRTFQGDDTHNINENITKDGKIITCEWKNSQLVNEEGEIIGIISMVEDITYKGAVKEEINTLSTIITQDPSGVILTDNKGNIIFSNDSFSRITGYSKEELIGKNPKLIAGGEHSKAFYEDLWTTILNGEVWEGQFKNKKKDGTFYYADSRIFPIKNNKGFIEQFACIQKDITESKDIENYLLDVSETMENQERLSMVGQMAAGIMHEINNPLSYIDINVHALKDMIKDIREGGNSDEILDEIKELAEDLEEGLESIKKIAAGLKRFTYRGQSNEFEKVDLNEEIKTVATISKNEYKYYCDLIIEAEPVDLVEGDPGKIKQVMLNLIINAVHAIREREDGRHGKIGIKTYQDDNWVYCEIKDDGIGIDEKLSNKIFESFFTTKEKGKGTGLGLSLSKKIVESEHGGELDFTSKVGEGTTFVVKLKRGVE